MTNLIRIKKGLDLHLVGEASGELSDLTYKSTKFAVIPDDYCGLVPKIMKKEGESVKSGEAIIYDKRFNDIKIVSPVSGTITKVIRGERRKLLRVEIESNNDNAQTLFNVTDLSRENIKQVLLQSGLWAMMRQRPYDIIPEPGKTIRDIFITTFDSAPLAPKYTLLNYNVDAFKKGVEILSKLTDGKVYIGCKKDNLIETSNSETYIIDGPHPAGNVGVQIANIKPVNKGENVWALDADVVTRIGFLFTKGHVDFTTFVALTGENVKEPKIIKTTAGISLCDLLKQEVDNIESSRIISGNVLTGVQEAAEGYLHFPFRQITVIPENANEAEFMGWASLSTKKYSHSRSFFSWLNKKKAYHFDAKVNGSERAIIMAGEYDEVFPMDIYSEFLLKAIMAKDIDKMEQLGIYEVAPEDFALCEFVDTSKIQLQKIVREGLNYLMRELN